MYKICIFDLDGTLLDTSVPITKCINTVMKKYGLPVLKTEQVLSFVGNGYKPLVERALLAGGDDGLKYYKDALVAYMEEFAIHSAEGIVPYDGIIELLEYLKKNNVICAVLSNKPHAQAIENIEQYFGKNIFSYILGQRDGIQSKPDPAGLFEILNKSGLDHEHALYIGDTQVDIQTGQSANVDTVAVTWGYRNELELKLCKPTYLVNVPKEIKSYL